MSRAEELRDTPTMTKASLLPDVDDWEYSRGFGALRLPVVKQVRMMVSEGFTKLHPQFASGSTGSSSSLIQNVFLQIRKLPRLALDPNLTGKLLYGENYNHELKSDRLSHPRDR